MSDRQRGMTSNQRFRFRFSFWVFMAEWRMRTLQRQQTGQVTKPIDKKEARERFAAPLGCFISSPQRRPAGPQQHVRNKHRLALKQTARCLKHRVPYQRTSPCERRVRKHQECISQSRVEHCSTPAFADVHILNVSKNAEEK